jgi:hypothetical protein
MARSNSPIRPREAPPLKAGEPNLAQGEPRASPDLLAGESSGSLLEVFYSNAVREFVGVSYNGGKVR